MIFCIEIINKIIKIQNLIIYNMKKNKNYKRNIKSVR
jgi:hypothetical protein